MWGALSDERTGLSFTIAVGLDSAVILGSESRLTHDHILLSDLRFPQPGGPGPRIYINPGTGWPIPCLYPLDTDHVETPRFHCCSPTVALLRICRLATGMCLPSRCPETASVYRVTA
jgi:hypothetical protein